MEVPVFIINGFLESGKTTFIKETLKGEDFNDGTKTLILACEEGEEEYLRDEMDAVNTKIVYVESPDIINKDYIIKQCNDTKAQRIFIEFNGMWNLEEFIQKFPSFLTVVQIITLVNAETYDMYLANMKQVMMEQYKMSEMVIINRCTANSDRASYRRSVKAVNGRAQVFFESSDGSSNDIQEILPFDISGNEIEISDEDFGIWYMDAMDNPDKYDGKIIKCKTVVYKPKQLISKGMFAPGRFAMTCCVDDIRYISFKCILDSSTQQQLKSYNDRDFIYLTAKAKSEYCKEYKGNGVVLYAVNIDKTAKPSDDLVYFN